MTTSAPTDPNTIVPHPAPWRCRATVYMIPFWMPAATAADPAFTSMAYAPLEHGAPFGGAKWGMPSGGISMLQLIRYSETPAGAYDELVVVPGSFEYPAPGGERKHAPRISRIYVSQRNTCWNGRKNWNIPKHLARFEFNEAADGSASFKVFPLDEGEGGGEASTPLFQCSFKPFSYVPYFPMSTRLGGMMGVNLACVQPPLPTGNGAATAAGGPVPDGDEYTAAALAAPGAEIVGTRRWCKLEPYIYSGRTCMGWFDLEQPDGGTFIPAGRRWLPGAKLENALLTFGDGEWWDTPEGLSK